MRRGAPCRAWSGATIAELPASPAYGSGALTDLLPSVAAALGEPAHARTLPLPPARRAVVVLVDGLGARLLQRFGGHAPTLRSAKEHRFSRTIDTVFPTTTAAALTSLATGLPPSRHGIVGYDTVDPARRRVVNQLGGWPGDLDPLAWQPHPTLLQRLEGHRAVVTVSRPKFRTSALTRAGLRGGSFVEARTPAARVSATLDVLREHRDALVYLYWDDLDKAGHAHGVDSDAWLHALEELDSALRRLAQRSGPGTLVLLTADHGMVDVPASARLDYAERSELLEGVELTAGEPRGVQLHFHPDADAALREHVRQEWVAAFGGRAWVLTREQVTGLGWFGPGWADGVAERTGDLLIAANGDLALYDGRRVAPHAMEMVGQHGSLTPAERKVPLLVLADGS